MPKHFDDTVKLDTVEVKFRKAHEMQKNYRAPQPPPVTSNKNVPYRGNSQKEVSNK